MDKLVITSDEDALRLLKDLTDGHVDSGKIQVKFDNWPCIHVYLKGEKFQQSLTPTVMKGFVELNKNLNKTFALLKYQDSSKRLTSEESKKLEFSVKVDGGSSDVKVDLSKSLEELVRGIASGVQNMESLHLLIGILGSGLLFAASFSFKKYLQHRTEIRLREIEQQQNAVDREVRLTELRGLQFASQQETERMNLLQKILTQQPQLKPIDDYAYNAHTELLKGLSGAELVKVQDSELKEDNIEELKSNARKRSVEDQLTGIFKVIGSDHSSKEECRLKLVNTVNNEQLNVSLVLDPESLAVPRMKELIMNAEWNNTPLIFTLIIRKNHEKITKAVIESVRTPALAGVV